MRAIRSVSATMPGYSWRVSGVVVGIFAVTTALWAPTRGMSQSPAAPMVISAMPVEQAPVTLGNLSAGSYQITFVHPYSCCPVTVCFCLPCGCPQVRCTCDSIRFKYPGLCNDVVIRFKKDGSVRVKD